MEHGLTHISTTGQPQMVDVGAKAVTLRMARAQAVVVLGDDVLRALNVLNTVNGRLNPQTSPEAVDEMANEIMSEMISKKGAVFQTAIIAGIMAAKRTGELIPLCHPIGMDNCTIDVAFNAERELVISCTASVTAQTGVEMEALTGASVAALTVYDMCKALSHDIVIKTIQLMEKRGGKRDFVRQ